MKQNIPRPTATRRMIDRATMKTTSEKQRTLDIVCPDDDQKVYKLDVKSLSYAATQLVHSRPGTSDREGTGTTPDQGVQHNNRVLLGSLATGSQALTVSCSSSTVSDSSVPMATDADILSDSASVVPSQHVSQGPATSQHYEDSGCVRVVRKEWLFLFVAMMALCLLIVVIVVVFVVAGHESAHESIGGPTGLMNDPTSSPTTPISESSMPPWIA